MICFNLSHLRSLGALVLLMIPLSLLPGRAAETPAAVPRESTTFVVDRNHPQASDSGPGNAQQPFKTISVAAQKAMPGDTVLVMPGVYRERVTPARGGQKGRPITYEAAPGHQVFVRGSEEWHPQWKAVAGHPGVWTASLDDSLFAGGTNPYRESVCVGPAPQNLPARPVSAWAEKTKEWLKEKEAGRMPRTLGQVFIDGEPLTECETVDAVYRAAGTWIVNEDGTGLIIHPLPSRLPLEKRLVELTVRDRVFAPYHRGLEYLVVRGFVFEHAANQGPFPQGGAVSLRSGGKWLVEDNIIRYAKTIGIDAGGEWFRPEQLTGTEASEMRLIVKADNVIRNNVISDNGLSGLAAWNCPRIVISGNRVMRNNALGLRPSKVDHGIGWEEMAGIKLHGATRAIISDNLVTDNQAHGIWIDNGFTNARITGNTLLNNAGAGIMLELGNGPCLIDHNIVAFTRQFSPYFAGDGIYGHDSSGLTVVHNLSFANARYGIFFQRITDRKADGKPVEASNLRVLNNLVVDNARAAINLPSESDRAHNNVSDYNVIGKRMLWLIPNKGEDNPYVSPAADKFRAFLVGNGGSLAKKDTSTRGLIDGMTLEEWQGYTGRDTHSVVANPKRLVIRSNTAEIEIQLDADAGLLTVPEVKLEATFPGDPLPSGTVYAGPWQDLGNTNRRFPLWPAKDFTPAP